ncbi:MAG: gluconate 2-dehydrogenase subunit 3 family protein [Vicinamibacterales bacterium]
MSLVIREPPAGLCTRRMRLLTALADAIVPATDAPGAVAAGVIESLAKWTAAAPPQLRDEFIAALDALEEWGVNRVGTSLTDMPAPERVTLLRQLTHRSRGLPLAEESRAAAHALQRVKMSVSSAYYATETGMRALGWQGPRAHQSCSCHGCSHTGGRHER